MKFKEKREKEKFCRAKPNIKLSTHTDFYQSISTNADLSPLHYPALHTAENRIVVPTVFHVLFTIATVPQPRTVLIAR